MKAKLRHWRPRYSLRFVLIGFVAVAVMIAIYREPLRHRLEALLAGKRKPVTVVISGPQTSGPAVALDPPTPDEIVKALAATGSFQPSANLRMIVEPVSHYVDPPKFSWLGPSSQLHHAHYKCMLISDRGTSTIYIDHNHRCVP